MRHLLAPVLALALLSTALPMVAPSASAERNCITVGDTAYFYLTYYVGSSWAEAYAALARMGCPGITSVLCQYYSQVIHPDCIVVAIAVPAVRVLAWQVSDEMGVTVAVDDVGVWTDAHGVPHDPAGAWQSLSGTTGLPSSPGGFVDGGLGLLP